MIDKNEITIDGVVYVKKELSKEEKNEILKKAWEKRRELRDKGNKLHAECDKLRAEYENLWEEGSKVWRECILKVYGNINIEWKNYSLEKDDHECHLGTGEVFKP